MSTRYLEKLIDEFHKLPGIGRKSAARLAFHILDMNENEVEKFSEAMLNVKNSSKNVLSVATSVKTNYVIYAAMKLETEV